MPVDPATVTPEQLAQVRALVPFTELSDAELTARLAADTCPVPQRLPNGELQRMSDGQLVTVDTVDVYGVAAGLWDLEAVRLEAVAPGTAGQVRSESNGDVARTYGDGTGRTAATSWAMARRMRRRALCPGKGGVGPARTVDVLPPSYQQGYTPGDPTTWPDPLLGPPAPAQLNAPYVVNRPEQPL